MIRTAIIIVSDRSARGERADETGPALQRLVEKNGFRVVQTRIVPDEAAELAGVLKNIADESSTDLILTSGGTGFAPRDITPEATREIIEKEVPGLSEMIRAGSSKITKRAYLSRGIAGIRKRTLIVNLPGSPKAAAESFEIISPVLEHGIEVLAGNVADCARA